MSEADVSSLFTIGVREKCPVELIELFDDAGNLFDPASVTYSRFKLGERETDAIQLDTAIESVNGEKEQSFSFTLKARSTSGVEITK